MVEAEVIIIGGGPAGSTCAWMLKQSGVDAIILDKAEFPRHKLCAGWITPKVLRRLQLDASAYPHSLTRYKKLHFYIRGRHVPVRTRQYAIRRIEFDHWLLQRANVPVYVHEVRKIECDEDRYLIDDQYRCRYLLGAGGTSCPVYRRFFREVNPRMHDLQITALEEEFRYDYTDENCRLWFYDNDLAGYSWYVPKRGGWLNIGIGAKTNVLQARGESIHQHWEFLVEKLSKLNLLNNHQFSQKGCTYYLRHPVNRVQIDGALIIGDSAGLATMDMGEGIGPAIESGIRAAQAILGKKEYSLRFLRRYSAFNILLPWL